MLHLGVEKDLLDFFLEDLTDETEIEAMKQDILVNFGYHGTGEKTYTLKDGEIDPDNNAIVEVLAGIPQVILAVETDAEGNVTGKTSTIEFTTETPGHGSLQHYHRSIRNKTYHSPHCMYSRTRHYLFLSGIIQKRSSRPIYRRKRSRCLPGLYSEQRRSL